MVLNAYTPTSNQVPLLYIQNFNQKLTCILKINLFSWIIGATVSASGS